MDQPEKIQSSSVDSGKEKISETTEQGSMPEVSEKVSSSSPASSVTDDEDTADISSALSVKLQDDSGAKKQSNLQAPKANKGSSSPYVKKAAKVIEDDKGNPYKKEEDLEYIQIDYLKNRFGKDIKKS